MKQLLMALCVIACVVMTARSAAACDNHRGIGSGLPYFGYGFSGSLYGLGYVPVPPYYALHPPVHYSHRVAVPYGASPYAASPARDRPAPQLIVNHLAPAPKVDRQKQAGIIVNPFYQLSSPSDEKGE
jgi:hypothetical protein